MEQLERGDGIQDDAVSISTASTVDHSTAKLVPLANMDQALAARASESRIGEEDDEGDEQSGVGVIGQGQEQEQEPGQEQESATGLEPSPVLPQSYSQRFHPPHGQSQHATNALRHTNQLQPQFQHPSAPLARAAIPAAVSNPATPLLVGRGLSAMNGSMNQEVALLGANAAYASAQAASRRKARSSFGAIIDGGTSTAATPTVATGMMSSNTTGAAAGATNAAPSQHIPSPAFSAISTGSTQSLSATGGYRPRVCVPGTPVTPFVAPLRSLEPLPQSVFEGVPAQNRSSPFESPVFAATQGSVGSVAGSGNRSNQSTPTRQVFAAYHQHQVFQSQFHQQHGRSMQEYSRKMRSKHNGIKPQGVTPGAGLGLTRSVASGANGQSNGNTTQGGSSQTSSPKAGPHIAVTVPLPGLEAFGPSRDRDDAAGDGTDQASVTMTPDIGTSNRRKQSGRATAEELVRVRMEGRTRARFSVPNGSGLHGSAPGSASVSPSGSPTSSPKHSLRGAGSKRESPAFEAPRLPPGFQPPNLHYSIPGGKNGSSESGTRRIKGDYQMQPPIEDDDIELDDDLRSANSQQSIVSETQAELARASDSAFMHTGGPIPQVPGEGGHGRMKGLPLTNQNKADIRSGKLPTRSTSLDLLMLPPAYPHSRAQTPSDKEGTLQGSPQDSGDTTGGEYEPNEAQTDSATDVSAHDNEVATPMRSSTRGLVAHRKGLTDTHPKTKPQSASQSGPHPAVARRSDMLDDGRVRSHHNSPKQQYGQRLLEKFDADSEVEETITITSVTSVTRIATQSSVQVASESLLMGKRSRAEGPPSPLPPAPPPPLASLDELDPYYYRQENRMRLSDSDAVSERERPMDKMLDRANMTESLSLDSRTLPIDPGLRHSAPADRVSLRSTERQDPSDLSKTEATSISNGDEMRCEAPARVQAEPAAGTNRSSLLDVRAIPFIPKQVSLLQTWNQVNRTLRLQTVAKFARIPVDLHREARFAALRMVAADQIRQQAIVAGVGQAVADASRVIALANLVCPSAAAVTSHVQEHLLSLYNAHLGSISPNILPGTPLGSEDAIAVQLAEEKRYMEAQQQARMSHESKELGDTKHGQIPIRLLRPTSSSCYCPFAEALENIRKREPSREMLTPAEREEVLATLPKPCRALPQVLCHGPYGMVKSLPSLKYLLKHARPGTLIALDIDDTIHGNAYLPSHITTPPGIQAFQQTLVTHQNYASLQLDVKNAHVRKLQEALHKKRILEEDTRFIIQELQRRGCLVFGLTSRYADMSSLTLQALRGLGIDLSLTAPFAADEVIMDSQTEAVYDSGIIFTNAMDKGTILNRFLENVIMREGALSFDEFADKLANIERYLNKEFARMKDEGTLPPHVYTSERAANLYNLSSNDPNFEAKLETKLIEARAHSATEKVLYPASTFLTPPHLLEYLPLPSDGGVLTRWDSPSAFTVLNFPRKSRELIVVDDREINTACIIHGMSCVTPDNLGIDVISYFYTVPLQVQCYDDPAPPLAPNHGALVAQTYAAADAVVMQSVLAQAESAIASGLVSVPDDKVKSGSFCICQGKIADYIDWPQNFDDSSVEGFCRRPRVSEPWQFCPMHSNSSKPPTEITSRIRWIDLLNLQIHRFLQSGQVLDNFEAKRLLKSAQQQQLVQQQHQKQQEQQEQGQQEQQHQQHQQ